MPALRYLRQRVVQTALAILVLVGSCQFFATTSAMAVYNNASIAINADFVCGIFCENRWDPVQPNTSVSRPGESGSLDVYTHSHNWYTYGCKNDVDAHGWVVFTEVSARKITVTTYHQDGSTASTCSFDPTTIVD